MKQLVQKLGSGNMEVITIPTPQLKRGFITIRNHYSLISPGTEGSTVKIARKSLLSKAKDRPRQFQQAVETLKNQGPVQAFRAVQKKLDEYTPLGYSCAGVVIGVGEGVSEFKVGDKVACAGAGYANHAEVVSVPVNLAVKLKPDANLKYAAYNTLGAISMQAVRQADLKIGESCAVIGMGLLGHLTASILKASGVQVVGIDTSPLAFKFVDNSADMYLLRSDPAIEEIIKKFTNGIGVDAVIIAAATSSLDPINLAGSIVRKKGRIVILGDVPTGFDREPHYYQKELELKMSCSYGPGRYDPSYEEKGIDYPIAYVRWTQKRNMEAFQRLVYAGAINLSHFTTHEFSIEDSPKAYDLILNKSEPFLGIVIRYDALNTQVDERLNVSMFRKLGKVNLAFIGAGNYAQGNLLPNLPKWNSIVRKGVLTNSGTTSKRVAERFNFEFCTSNEDDILKNEEINTVFIATRHDSHANYVLKALNARKHVFVEKPLCLTETELKEIENIYKNNSDLILMVGFNRRFSLFTEIINKNLGTGPMTMLYRVNAGSIPTNSWVHDIQIGGGRIVGEVCHFIDYLTFLNGSLPVKVFAQTLPDPHNLNDTVNITIGFKNGSTGVVAYYANGSKKLPKEYIEVYRAGSTAVLDNYRKLQIFSMNRIIKKKLFSQDKGQKSMIEQFIKLLQEGGKPLISFEEIYYVTKASFAVMESIRTGRQINLL